MKTEHANNIERSWNWWWGKESVCCYMLRHFVWMKNVWQWQKFVVFELNNYNGTHSYGLLIRKFIASHRILMWMWVWVSVYVCNFIKYLWAAVSLAGCTVNVKSKNILLLKLNTLGTAHWTCLFLNHNYPFFNKNQINSNQIRFSLLSLYTHIYSLLKT